MSRRAWFAIAAIFIAAGFAWYVSARPMDFRVYYYGAQKVFTGTGPVYGETSGIGWPMHYRYPPLFLFLALPFTALPIAWAAALWVVLKCAALALLARGLWKRLGPPTTEAAWVVPLLLAGPYVIEDLRYGNTQSFIFALTGAALLSVPAAPFLAAAALALAISIKVWPLFFVPFLAARRQWKAAGLTLVLTIALLLIPAMYFGFQGNLDLLAQWFHQEFATQTGQTEIWFPSQSLRGVMMRYLTVIDYSQVPDSNYPLVQVAALDPTAVRVLWAVLSGAGYAALITLTVRRKTSMFGVLEALAFAAVILLEPFSQKYTLVVMLWPAIIAGRLVGNHPARGLLYAAMAIVLVQPLVYGAGGQRLVQVLGFDFLATALLAAFFLVSILAPSTERYARY